MSALRSALQKRFLNFRNLYGIPQCLERHSTFNSFYISRLAHTSAKNGESGNTSRSAQKSDPGYTKAESEIRSARNYSSHTYKKRNNFTPMEYDHRRISVGGLSKFTTEGSMYAYFCKFGSVEDCKIERDKFTGLSTKAGYVEFESSDQANRAVESFPHVIDGQEVNVFPYINKGDFKKNQLMIRGLPQEISQMTLRNFYSQFGQVLYCKIIRDEGNVSRGYAFVSFKSGEAVDLALNSLPHRIDDNEFSNVHRAHLNKRELTLRVMDLPAKTTEESLREFYSKFGRITRCNLIRNLDSGQLKYGVVAFGTQEDLDHALEAEPHVIDGTEVFLSYMTSELDLRVKVVPEGVTRESFEKFFSQYGELRDCRFEKSPKGHNNLYVHFATIDAVNRALADRPHIVEGKLVKTIFANRTKQATFSLFIGSLPESATENSLFETFSKFGKLVHWQIDGRRYQSTPYGFVSFGTAEEALTALNSGPHLIEGTTLDVRKAREVAPFLREQESDDKSEN